MFPNLEKLFPTGNAAQLGFSSRPSKLIPVGAEPLATELEQREPGQCAPATQKPAVKYQVVENFATKHSLRH